MDDVPRETITHPTEDRPYGDTYTTGRSSTSNRAEGGLFMFQKPPPALACFRVILVGVSHVGPREQQVSIATTQRLHRQSALNEAFCCAATLPFLYWCHLRTISFFCDRAHEHEHEHEINRFSPLHPRGRSECDTHSSRVEGLLAEP